MESIYIWYNQFLYIYGEQFSGGRELGANGDNRRHFTGQVEVRQGTYGK